MRLFIFSFPILFLLPAFGAPYSTQNCKFNSIDQSFSYSGHKLYIHAVEHAHPSQSDKMARHIRNILALNLDLKQNPQLQKKVSQEMIQIMKNFIPSEAKQSAEFKKRKHHLKVLVRQIDNKKINWLGIEETPNSSSRTGNPKPMLKAIENFNVFIASLNPKPSPRKRQQFMSLFFNIAYYGLSLSRRPDLPVSLIDSKTGRNLHPKDAYPSSVELSAEKWLKQHKLSPLEGPQMIAKLKELKRQHSQGTLPKKYRSFSNIAYQVPVLISHHESTLKSYRMREETMAATSLKNIDFYDGSGAILIGIAHKENLIANLTKFCKSPHLLDQFIDPDLAHTSSLKKPETPQDNPHSVR